MKYEVGDTVLLLHSNEEGTIVEIMNEEMVLVNVVGVEFPVFTDQIEYPYFKRFSEQSREKKEQNTKKSKIYIDQVRKEKGALKPDLTIAGMQLKLIPVYESQSFEDNIQYFRFYLLNTLPEAFHFEYSVHYRGDPDFVLTNNIDAQTDFYLHNIHQEELNDIIKFQFLFSPVQNKKGRTAHLNVPLKLKAKTLFQKVDVMHRQNEPFISFQLFDTYPQETIQPYYPLPEKKPQSLKAANLEPALSVVDLHLEKIPGSNPSASNYEKLQLQLQYFEKYYRLAVAHMEPKLIVIHGIGSGRLREEIHEILKHKPEVRSFVNQYHPSFGFGATEIYFQY